MKYRDNIGWFVGRLSSLLAKELNQQLFNHKTGITADQFRLLTNLWIADGITQQRLSDLRGRDRASITRMIDLLEEQGLVTRIPDADDRRVNLIYLTEKGKALEPDAYQSSNKVLAIAMQGFTPEEEETLKKLLAKAIDNLKG